MKWVVFLAVATFVVFRFFGSKNHQCDKSNQNVCDQPAGKKKKDDFARGSVGSLFLMEEFIDPGIGGRESVNQSLAQSEQRENDFFEDEFFD